MTSPSKKIRFQEFIDRLSNARQATDRTDAHSLLTSIMDSIEDSYGFDRNDYVDRMHVFSLSSDFDWQNLDGDPCYWDDAFKAKHRTVIFNNGRIVIKQLHGSKTVLLDKAGSE